MKQTRNLLLFFCILCSQVSFAQDIPGYNNSNYAGISGVYLQPASIADMRYTFDMTLFGAGFAFNNNYVALNAQYLRSGEIFDTSKTNHNDFQKKYLYENTSNVDKAVGLNMTIQGPAFAIALSKNISIGFSVRNRTMFNVDQMSPELAHLSYTGLNYTDSKNLTYWNVKLNNDHFNINTMMWNEYAFSYAQVINGGGPHFLKVGGTAKLLQGIAAAYIYAQDLSYAWKNNDTLSLYNAKFSYGHSTSLTEMAQKGDILSKVADFSGTSVGFDVGAVYEWRPDYNDFVYDMDGKTGLERRDKPKYKLRLGVSILDIGSIRFNKSNDALDFLADKQNWNVNGLQFGNNKVLGFDSMVHNVFPNQLNNKKYFVFALPTSFSVQIDYNIYKDLYLNFTSYTSPRWLDIESKVHNVGYYSITPRWDNKWFGVFLPMALDGNGNFNMGASVRLGPLIVGTSNGLNLLLSNHVYNLDGYFSIKIPIFQHKPPKDKDRDGVSDKKDKCPDVKGSWAHHGCPDTDGDGVYDDADQCPTIPGVVENHGCPWPDTDGDGVADKNDSCPTVKGPKENHGCPWGDADKDGVPDNLDSCKFIAGPAQNHGCPWGDADNDGVADNLDSCPTIAGPPANHGCPWGDADNDGVTDNLDSCPHTPGPASNHGCPVIAKKQQEIINTAFHNLEFELNKSIIKKSSYISLDELAKLMKDHPKYKIRLTGHTDNVGTEETNEKLSRDRAMAVRDALVKRGVDPDRIKVEWHGSTQPIAPNTTEEGRAKNRRVEMKIVFD
jgi:outer membrane protein OmpA-like peptidoglycan-associated protein